ncbi:hypothetical protein FS749_006509 [Ceratobasidium sp. UAMH 11750]|nr:hypothetical protein FS749_006509 [Ceratobasidium sp. UAMH 11750]
MPPSTASSLLSKLQKALDEKALDEEHPRPILEFIDSLERRFPSTKLRHLFMANPFYPFAPPQLPDDITAVDLNAIGIGFNSELNPNVLNAPHVALSHAPAGSDHNDARVVRRRLDEPHAGVNPMQTLNNPAAYAPGANAFVPLHRIPFDNPPRNPAMYAQNESAPAQPHSYASMYTLGHIYGQPAHSAAATPILSLNTVTPTTQPLAEQATQWNVHGSSQQAPPIPLGTRPGGGAATNLHDRLLASLAAETMPEPGPPSSISRTYSGSPGNTSLSFAHNSGNSVTSFPSNAAYTDAAPDPSASYTISGHMALPQNHPSFNMPVHYSCPQNRSGLSGSQVLRTPALQSTYNPRNSPPRLATRAGSPTSSLVLLSSPVRPLNNSPAPETQVATSSSGAAAAGPDDDDLMEVDALNADEQEPCTGGYYPKSLYPLGAPFLPADERVALFSTPRANFTWLLCERSLLLLGVFTEQTKEHKGIVWAALKAPTKGRYHSLITTISETIFNKARSESAVWHNVRSLATTYVAISKFNKNSHMKWNYDLPDKDLFPVIQAEIDQRTVQDSKLAKLLACEYILWTQPGDKRWIDLVHYHLHDHPNYKTEMLHSGNILDEPDEFRAPTNRRASQASVATPRHETQTTSQTASTSGSYASKGKKQALPVENAEVSGVVPSPPLSTANSSTRPTSTPRSLIRKATAPRTADRTTGGSRSQVDKQPESVRSSASSPANLEMLRYVEHTGKESVQIQRDMAVSEERLNNAKAVAVFKEVQQQRERLENDKRVKEEHLKLECAQVQAAAKAERRKNYHSFCRDLPREDPYFSFNLQI